MGYDYDDQNIFAKILRGNIPFAILSRRLPCMSS